MNEIDRSYHVQPQHPYTLHSLPCPTQRPIHGLVHGWDCSSDGHTERVAHGLSVTTLPCLDSPATPPRQEIDSPGLIICFQQAIVAAYH